MVQRPDLGARQIFSVALAQGLYQRQTALVGAIQSPGGVLLLRGQRVHLLAALLLHEGHARVRGQLLGLAGSGVAGKAAQRVIEGLHVADAVLLDEGLGRGGGRRRRRGARHGVLEHHDAVEGGFQVGVLEGVLGIFQLGLPFIVVTLAVKHLRAIEKIPNQTLGVKSVDLRATSSAGMPG